MEGFVFIENFVRLLPHYVLRFILTNYRLSYRTVPNNQPTVSRLSILNNDDRRIEQPLDNKVAVKKSWDDFKHPRAPLSKD